MSNRTEGKYVKNIVASDYTRFQSKLINCTHFYSIISIYSNN